MKVFKRLLSAISLFAFFLIFSISGAYAQTGQGQQKQMEVTTYTLEGKIVDSETEDAIADAQVFFVANADRNTTSDAEGQFTIENLPSGTYTIIVKAQGDQYKLWKKDVTVNGDKEITVKLETLSQY